MSPETTRKISRLEINMKSALALFIFLSLFLFSAAGNPVFGWNSSSDETGVLLQTSDSEDLFLKEYQEGRDLCAKEEWNKASEKFNKILGKYPKHNMTDAVLYWLAFSYKKQNKFLETEETLMRLIREFPSSEWADDARVMTVEIFQELIPLKATTADVFRPSRKLEPVKVTPALESQITKLDLSTRPVEVGVISLEVYTGLDTNSEIKLAALNSLFFSDQKKAIELSGEILGPDSKATVRMKENVLRLMERSRDASAVSVIIEVIRGENDVKVRKAAISTLGWLNFDAAGDFLLQLYNSESSPEIKMHVIFALSRHPRSLPKLIEISRVESNLQLRRTAISGISRIGAEQGIEFLVKLYDTETNLEIKNAIILALGKNSNKQALRKLMNIAGNDQSPQMKIKAINALGGNTDPEVIKFLQEIIR